MYEAPARHQIKHDEPAEVLVQSLGLEALRLLKGDVPLSNPEG
jgi:hypothetical protein